jgi:hypothetical protein
MTGTEDTEWAADWQRAHDAAEGHGASNPRACADRYMQGRGLRLMEVRNQEGRYVGRVWSNDAQR